MEYEDSLNVYLGHHHQHNHVHTDTENHSGLQIDPAVHLRARTATDETGCCVCFAVDRRRSGTGRKRKSLIACVLYARGIAWKETGHIAVYRAGRPRGFIFKLKNSVYRGFLRDARSEARNIAGVHAQGAARRNTCDNEYVDRLAYGRNKVLL